MSGLLQHLKVSAVADGPDNSQVQPSDWNAAHVFAGGNHGAIPIRDTGDATYGGAWLASVAAGQVLISNGVAQLPTWASSLTLGGGLTTGGMVSIGPPTIAASFIRFGVGVTYSGLVGLAGAVKSTGALDLGFFVEAGLGMSWMVNGSATDAMTLSAAGVLSAAKLRIGPIGAAGAGSVQPAEFIGLADCGLALTAPGTGAPGTEEVYLAAFMRDASTSYQKVGAEAFQWTDKDPTAGYASWNVHTTAYTAGVTNDYFGLTVWAKHGAAFFPAGLGAAEAPGLNILKVNGGLWVGPITATVLGAKMTIDYYGEAFNGLTINESGGTTAGTGLVHFAAAKVGIGNITRVGTTNAVAYNTSSDARLKRDRGAATDLARLRDLVVRDFEWIVDGTVDRGLFAQEAYPLYPLAVTPGTDERTAEGALARPWSADYSRFVPDLILGWQQHDDAISKLAAHLAILERRAA